MPELDPQMAAILALANAAELKSYITMTPAEARIEQERRNLYWNEKPITVAKVEDHHLTGAFGPRLLRVYDDQPQAGTRPGIVYFHGGGWVIGSPDSHDVIGRGLARVTGLPVLSYDYVKAPERPFPEPIDDCTAAFLAIQACAAEFSVEPTRLGIGGDSAGAALSLNVGMALRHLDMPKPVALALIYPVATMAMNTPSHREFGNDDYLLSTEMMRWFGNQYVADEAHLGDPRLELIAADLRQLAPTYLSIAEFDPLADEGHALFDRLRLHGVEAECHIWRGVTHASLVMGRDLDQANRFITEIGDFFNRRLRSDWTRV